MAVDLVTVGCICADVTVRPVDRLPAVGTLELVDQLELHVGGLAGVTAMTMSRLGASAAFVGRLGEDSFGDYLLTALASAGVSTDYVRRDNAHGTSATVVLINPEGERTFLHHLGTNAATGPEDLDMDYIGSARVLHWGGPGVTPGLEGTAMAGVYEQARRAGVLTSVDTCYDGQGRWLPLLEPSLHHLDIVFTSMEEAPQYTGKGDVERIADFFLDYGVTCVVVKLGGEGVYVKSTGESHHVPAHAVEVVDTTGAGDAACAGFLYGYINQWGLRESARLANAVGGLTVQCMGGAEGGRSLEETVAFMKSP